MLGAVLELDHLCFGGLWTLEAYQRELNSPNSVLLGLLASPAPPAPPASPAPPSPLLAMGCLWAILDEAHITILAVHPHYQRQGLGQVMLLALLQVAADRGLERATLEVRASNQPALSLYQKFGFKIAGRRRRYYKDTNEDALILWRGNLQHPEFYNTLPTWQKSVSDRLSLAGWKLQLPLNLPLLDGSSLTME
ncbi:ribosomal protein S18-alanine N-acetyltransferase [Chroococcidiopsis sp. CCMEE 29]|uniref:ribosomal protein S18-alanine N-acetyltransferase n=1 Tax=Chroococcidiopsis sp. CCMEE 29 TaxID=155894 RepID=UPI0031F81611